jgi:methyl-accepting chemotaxis protein
LVAWAFTAVERATRIEEAVKGLHETTRAQSQMIQEIKDSMTALRDVAQAHGKQIAELARVVSAKPPAVDPPGIKVLIEQTKQVRDELKQIRDAVSRSGAASRPR